MGDRVAVKFRDFEGDMVQVYLHWGASDVRALLDSFFQVEEGRRIIDNRFDDAPYLAARFVVYAASDATSDVGLYGPDAELDGAVLRVLCMNSDRPEVVDG